MTLDVNRIRNSFALVVEREPQLTRRFYANLFERYPRARVFFQRNTGRQQEKMLRDALMAVMEHLEDAPWLARELGTLGRKHVEYGVTDEMYDWVGDALLVTLREVSAEAWSPELESAWTGAYAAIARLMKAGAAAASRSL
jgi:hemoglobin-like flavoprotein